jgi:internalin A
MSGRMGNQRFIKLFFLSLLLVPLVVFAQDESGQKALKQSGATIHTLPDGTVVSVYASGASNFSGKDLELVSGYRTLRVLYVVGRPLVDKDLLSLPKLKALNKIVLEDCPGISDEGMESISELAKLQTLLLDKTSVGDAGLRHLAKLGNLQELSLRETKVTDDGLREIARLKDLRTLDLSGTMMSGAGLQELTALGSLEVLYLNNTQVDENAVKHLTKLRQLRRLFLDNTRLSEDAVRAIRRAIPQCRVYYRVSRT